MSSGTARNLGSGFSPSPKRTPRKLNVPESNPLKDPEPPSTPSPQRSQSQTASQLGQGAGEQEQRDLSTASPAPAAEDTRSQASGSVSGLGGKMSSIAGGIAGGLKIAVSGVSRLGQGGSSSQVGDTVGQVGETVEQTLDLSALKGLEVGQEGGIADSAGNVLGRIVEGDPRDLVGYVVNENGEILDQDGDLIGRAEIIPEAAQKVAGAVEEAVAVTELSALAGKEVNDEGLVKDDDGTVIGKVVEGEAQDLVGFTANEEGKILDQDGDLVGKVDVVAKQTADEATSVAQDAGSLAEGAAPSEGKVSGAESAAGSGTARAKSGVDEAAEGVQDLSVDENKSKAYDATSKADDATSKADTSSKLDETRSKAESGSKIDDAESKADEAGSKIDETGSKAEETTSKAPDDATDVSADFQPAKEEQEAKEGEGEEEEPKLPPLSILEGLTTNKTGNIISPSTGKPIGKVVEGDVKRLARGGNQLDAKGQFWDNRGNVIGKAETLPTQEYEEEAMFAGLEGLHVVEDGFVEDDNGKRVGKIVEGDAKKVLGRAVDQDGEVTDSHGNVIAKAEHYEEPEAEPEAEPEMIDLSSLNGLSPNKLGLVIGPKGIPIGRVVEGNPKELAGKEIDDGVIYDGRKPVGRVELIPEEEREKKAEGPFAGLEGLVVDDQGFVIDENGNQVGKITEGDIKQLRGRSVDEDGDVIDKFGSVKGHAEPYTPPEEEPQPEVDLSILEGKVVNKFGNVVDGSGTVFGRLVEGDKRLAGRKVDRYGQIWGDNGEVIGRAELIPGAEEEKPEGSFYGVEGAVVGKDGVVVDGSGRIIGRVIEGDAKKLEGRKVDEDGDILDKNGNSLGRAERWEPEEKKRTVNPMSGRKVTREGEVRDADGNLIGKLTSGNLPTLVGKEVDDNGFVVDNDGNKLGECTLIENIPEPEPEGPEPEPEPEEPEPTKEELEAQKDRELAKKMSAIVGQTLDRVRPICKMILDYIDKAERTPKDELDEEELVKNVKPLIEEAGSILQECNGAIRALDPDGHIAATAKARAASHEASPEEYALADQIKELTDTVVSTIEKGKRLIADMPHAKKELNPLWALLSEPLFQIIAAVGLLLTGVLGLVGRLLEGLGLGPLVHGLLGGLGLDKLLSGLGLTSLTDALGITGKKKK
ncbi:hypothetical protein N8T08_005703 [Aspergillus melleus]|uniref:Uncharacterized protein n=1 Tax=Aspergillus melleus TaxID=138277 RepID=A0ACC3B1U2_9EURO|nr:hypothetical protein N8T08_005703 [Aspergillus melleus]